MVYCRVLKIAVTTTVHQISTSTKLQSQNLILSVRSSHVTKLSTLLSTPDLSVHMVTSHNRLTLLTVV